MVPSKANAELIKNDEGSEFDTLGSGAFDVHFWGNKKEDKEQVITK